jgi:hypothetical protein
MKALLFAAMFILIHDNYPPLCCNGDAATGDCHPVPCDQVTETDRGYAWHGFLFTADQTHISFDRQCHACVSHEYVSGKPVGEPRYPRCLFILPTA